MLSVSLDIRREQTPFIVERSLLQLQTEPRSRTLQKVYFHFYLPADLYLAIVIINIMKVGDIKRRQGHHSAGQFSLSTGISSNNLHISQPVLVFDIKG